MSVCEPLGCLKQDRVNVMLQDNLTFAGTPFGVYGNVGNKTNAVRDHPRSGRPRVTNNRQDNWIRTTNLRNRFQPATVTARSIPGLRRISPQTVCRRLRCARIVARRPARRPNLTGNHRQARLQWCRQRLHWTAMQWGKVLFTDESRFHISYSDGRISRLLLSATLNSTQSSGRAGFVEHIRNGQRLRYLTNEPEYSYDKPLYFHFDEPVQILPGDSLVTTCTFQSTYKKKWVHFGDATSDEMCYVFLWYYPEYALKKGNCVSWKSINICGDESITVGNCNVWEFLFQTNAQSKALYTAVYTNCNLASNMCTPECKMAVMDYMQHPCMRGGDVTGFVRRLMIRSKPGLEFLGQLRMCDVNKNDYGFPTSGAAGTSMVSLLLIMLAMLMA